MACLLAVGFLGIAPVANDASAGKSIRKPATAAGILCLRCNVVAAAHAFPCLWARATIYYDYPYYYSRGHYPTHIGGYVYYPRNYYTRGFSRGPGSSQRPRARGHWLAVRWQMRKRSGLT